MQKYQATRIRTGDYLVPSNDRATLYRIVKGSDGWYVYSTPMPESDAALRALDFSDYVSDEWQSEGLAHPTKRDALASLFGDVPPSIGNAFRGLL